MRLHPAPRFALSPWRARLLGHRGWHPRRRAEPPLAADRPVRPSSLARPGPPHPGLPPNPRRRQLCPSRHDRLRPGPDPPDQLEPRHRGPQPTLPAGARFAADRRRGAAGNAAGRCRDAKPGERAPGGPGAAPASGRRRGRGPDPRRGPLLGRSRRTGKEDPRTAARDLPQRPARRHPRRELRDRADKRPRHATDPAAGPARRGPHPRRRAPGAGRTAVPDRDRRPLLRRHARALHLRLLGAGQRRCRLQPRPPRLPLPGRPRRRLQHLPDDPGPTGGGDPRHARGHERRPRQHRRRRHRRRPDPRRHLRDPHPATARGTDPGRRHRRRRGPHRHLRRPRPADSGDRPPTRRAHLVAIAPRNFSPRGVPR